jgi:hypothetical protein
MLSLILSEGLYLVVFPPVAAFAPLMALLIGLVAGWQRLGAEVVFTQSAIILLLAVVFGFIGGQLGFMFVAGYALADFTLYANPMSPYEVGGQIRFRVALLITYAALIVLAAGIPLFVRLLRAQMPPLERISADLLVVVDVVLSGILSALFVFAYLQALAVIIRPLYTWQGQSPTVDAMILVQNWGWVFALIALIITAVRVLVEYGVAAIDSQMIEEFARPLTQAERSSLGERLPTLAKVIVQAVLATLFLSGMLDAWYLALILFVALLAIESARRIGAKRIGVWPQIMRRIPANLRMAAAFGAAYLLSAFVLAGGVYGSSFRPLVWALIISLTCVALVFPEGTPQTEQRPEESR